MSVLVLDRLSVDFHGRRGAVSALRDVSLTVEPGEILGLAGESGCGKSTLALSLLGLLPPSASITGSARFDGTELVGTDDDVLRRLRGGRIGMIFQDPATALDPCFGIGGQVAEGIRVHGRVGRRAARDRSLALLDEVGLPAPRERYGDPPHRLSGGQRQRVVIASALANDPDLVLADEPTTALDATVQAQVLQLLDDLRRRRGTAIVLITHDLGVVAEICDRVAILYAGQLVEQGPVADVFREPAHPYTRALLAALPGAHRARGTLRALEGRVPDLADPPPGCRFAPRCPVVLPACGVFPPRTLLRSGHAVSCWHVEKGTAGEGPR